MSKALNKLPRMDNVRVEISRMTESSGNVQFFVRARRLDDSDTLFGNILEHQCFQTKHIDEEQCVKYALFSSTYLIKFFGQSADDVKLCGFTEDNMKIVEAEKRFWRH